MSKPIIYNLDPELYPDEETQNQLKNLSEDPDAFSHVAVMPDVHSKKGRKCPTGTIFASEKSILPQVMDTAPNCGMRLLATPWQQGDLSKKQINDLFLALVKTVPTRTYIGNLITPKVALDICRFGSKALLKFLKVDEATLQNEIENTFHQGNFFPTPPSKEEILSAVPRFFLFFALFRLGILGEAGNHFFDLMTVDKIHDPEKAHLLGIKEKQLLFLIHTGSGVFGQYSSYFFTPKKEEHLSMKIITDLGRLTFQSKLLTRQEMTKLQQEVKEFRDKKEFFRLDPQSPRGQAYLIANRSSANYGFANRVMITHNLKNTIASVFGEKPDLKLIYDTGHVFVDREEHENTLVWIHRNGASRGFGPSRMASHPIFSKTGEPGLIAGSMSTPSFLVCGTDENAATFYSINHGSGRAKNPQTNAPTSNKALKEKMLQSQIPLYNANSKGVIKQAAEHYKNVNTILDSTQKFHISTPVAELKPIAVLMA